MFNHSVSVFSGDLIPRSKGQPYYGRSRKVRPPPRKRKKRNRPGFVSMWHLRGAGRRRP